MVAINYEKKYVDRNEYSRSGDKLLSLQAIVIHYTANHGGDADMHYRYFSGGSAGRYAGAHLFVDRNKALEIVPLNEVCYHANERKAGPLLPSLKASAPFYPGGNANLLTVGIEMCMERDGTIHPDTITRTQLVVKRLQSEYPQLKDTQNRVVRHYDITGKNCPAPFVASKASWNAFLDGIDAPVTQKPKPITPPKVPTPTVRPNPKYTLDPSSKIGKVVIGKEPMNYRTEPDIDAPILRELPAGHKADLYEIHGVWLRLGVGWISNYQNAYAEVTMTPIKPAPEKETPVVTAPPKQTKEDDEMEEVAIVINTQADYKSARALHIRRGYPLYERGAVKRKVAKHLIIVGGGTDGLAKYCDKMTDLSGATWQETANNVVDYLNE